MVGIFSAANKINYNNSLLWDYSTGILLAVIRNMRIRIEVISSEDIYCIG